MRFKYGPVPEDENFYPVAQGWSSLREPRPIIAFLISAPIGLLLVIGIYLLTILLTPFKGLDLVIDIYDLLLFLPTMLILFATHELLHAIFFPWSDQDNIYIGFWPKYIVFYAFYNGELSRNRFISSLLAPFIVLSIIPIIIMAIFKTYSGFFFLVAVLNALSACVDIFNTLLILQTSSRLNLRIRAGKLTLRMLKRRTFAHRITTAYTLHFHFGQGNPRSTLGCHTFCDCQGVIPGCQQKLRQPTALHGFVYATALGEILPISI